MKRYSEKELLERLLEFKTENKRYPSIADFNEGKLGFSYRVLYRRYGRLKEAFKNADLYENGELEILENTDKKRGEFRCSFCGSWTMNPEAYYQSLAVILSGRFISLLNENKDRAGFEAVMNCIKAVFGTRNKRMRPELEKAGYLEKFDDLFKVSDRFDNKVSDPQKMDL